MKARVILLLALGLTTAFSGCAEQPRGNRKPTARVTGQVVVDGRPVPAGTPLKVECHSVHGIDKSAPSISSALTGDDGHFEISTYESGDGVPAGDYVLTFVWGKMNLMAATYGGPDKLKGRYSNAQKSEVKFTVREGEATDFGRIELTTE